jgi:hypothetical protein
MPPCAIRTIHPQDTKGTSKSTHSKKDTYEDVSVDSDTDTTLTKKQYQELLKCN